MNADGHDADKDAPPMREEWAVRHAQGVYAGDYGRPLTEQQAREWAKENAARDERRRLDARGKTRLLRRLVTEWEEVPASVFPPAKPGADS